MKFKRLICMLLVLIMTLTVVSCASGDETNETEDSVVSTEAVLDEWGRPVQHDKLPTELRYDGTEINIYMYRTEDFMVEKVTGDIVRDEIFKRNKRVEERLGVTLNYLYETGDTWDASMMNTNIRTDAMGGTEAYDLFALFAYNATASATEGYLSELHGLDYLELEADWYSKDFVENMTIENRLYSTIGSATLSSSEYSMLLFCNNDLLEEYTEITSNDLLNTVIGGEWTLDVMNQLVKQVYYDENGNGADEKDTYGLALQPTAKTLDSWLYSAGVRLVDKDVNNELTLVFEDTIQKSSDIYGKVYGMLYENEGSYIDSDTAPLIDGGYLEHFKRGKSCFTAAWMMSASEFYQAEVDYSILPYPKADSDQDSYYVTPHDKHNVMAVPAFCKDSTCSSAVLELLSKYSYDAVYPIYFEDIMRYRYVENDTGAQVYDIIMDSVGIDFGTFYQNSLAEIKNTVLRNPLYNGEGVGGFTSAYNNNATRFKTALDTLKKDFLSN